MNPLVPPIVSVTFVFSSLLVIMIPGPDLALITQLVITRRGAGPAVAASVGMITAGAVQIVVGALGLTILFATRPALFTAFRWAGGAVLLVMAAYAARAALRPPDPGAVPGPTPPTGRAFLQGLLCTGTNPKVGLFVTAFLPQFVPPGVEPRTGVAVLAVVYLGMGLLWLMTWIAAVGRAAKHLHSPHVARISAGLTTIVFTALAVRAFLG